MLYSWLRAFRELKADRSRTLLSLLGIAVGIFSIVAALALVDSLQASLRDSFAAYGSDILFVDKEPLEPDLTEDGEFRWWKYAARPPVSWQDYRYLRENGADLYSEIAYVAYGIHTTGVDGDWRLLVRQPLAEGRSFTPEEIESGAAVAIAGCETEAKCGDLRWLDGKRYRIVGMFEKAGMMTVSPVDIDRLLLVPARGQSGPVVRCSVLLSGAEAGQIRRLMRSARRLGPLQEDDFALNRLSFLMNEMNDLFALAAKLGWLIGLFALLSGGFGIANMLYVSVEERRSQIGICRALGARRKSIVRDFLREAVILSLLGAAVGIAFVLLTFFILQAATAIDLPIALNGKSVLTGLLTALLTGLLFGVAPARAAAALSPAKTMSQK